MDPAKAATTNNQQSNFFKTHWVKIILVLFTLIVVSILGTYFYQKQQQNIQPPTTTTTPGETVTKVQIVDGQVIKPEQDSPIRATLFNTKGAEGKLQSSLHIENNGGIGFEKLIYSISLTGPDEIVIHNWDGQDNEVLNQPLPIAQKDSDPFSLKPGEKKTFEIEMDYPAGAPSAEYALQVEIRPEEENIYLSTREPVQLKQSGQFLSIDYTNTCKINANNSKYKANLGPNINPNESVTAECEVTNKGDSIVTATPLLTYAERFVYKYTLSEEKTITENAVTWKPGETKTITFNLPPQTKPEVYEAMLQLVDKNNLSVSSVIPFRYVVRGPSAIIRSVELTTAEFAKGESIQVKIWGSPSMDLFWNGTPRPEDPLLSMRSPNEGTFLKQPKILVEVVSSTSKVCAKKTIDMPKLTTTWDEFTADLTAENDCINPTVTTKVFESDQQLFQFQKKFLSPNDGTNLSSKNNLNNIFILIGASILIILIIIIILFFLWRKKKGSPTIPPIIALFILSVLGLMGIYLSSSITEQVKAANYIIPIDGSSWISVHRGWLYEYRPAGIGITYSSNQVNVSVNGRIRCNSGCNNCNGSNYGFRTELKIDGKNAQISGRPGGDAGTYTDRSASNEQDLGTSFTATAQDGTNLAIGVHTAEVRVMALYATSGQHSGQLGGYDDDRQCGRQYDTCWAYASTNWGSVPCTPNPQEYQYPACPAGQWGTRTITRTSSCPGPTWSAWNETNNCQTPALNISTSPTSGWAPASTTISWNSSGFPPGTSCTNSWGGPAITPNTTSSEYRVFNSTPNLTISCTNPTYPAGNLSRQATFTVNQLAAPTLTALSTSCDYSAPRTTIRMQAPTGNYPGAMTITLYMYNGGNPVAQASLNPGGIYDISSINFTGPGNTNLSPNGYTTFYATTSVAGLTSSGYASLPVFIPNCPSAPIVNSVSPACNASTYQPYNSISYQNSTYGSPSTYHLDRMPNGQPFTAHGQGYVGSYASGTNPIQDYSINNNSLYSYRIRGDNGTYQSTPSNVVSATSPNCTPPTISATARCIDNSTNPEYSLTVTSNSNVGRDMQYSMNINGIGKLTDVYIPGPSQSATRTFTSPVLNNGALYTFSSNSWNTGIPASYTNYVSLTLPDCSLPRQFNISLNTTGPAVCPTDGLPKLNVNINKSANASTYELLTYQLDSSNNYVAYPTASRTYTSAELFPSATIVSNVGSATRTFNVDPNKNYRVYVIARNSTNSYIFSNFATANTNPSTDPAVYATYGYCDNTPPTIIMSSVGQCYQPNQLPTTIGMTVVDNPASGAPINSVSGVKASSIRFLLNEITAPAVVTQYPHQTQAGNTFSRVFTSADFNAGINKDYELSAFAQDNNNNPYTLPKITVSYAQVCGAWIQTRQGNVHSEKEINAPGGPY